MKIYTADYMRGMADELQRSLKVPIGLSDGRQQGMDWEYQLRIAGELVSWPSRGSLEVPGLPAGSTWASSEAICGFLLGLVWVGPELVADIIERSENP